MPGWIEGADITCLEVDAPLAVALGSVKLRRLSARRPLGVRASVLSVAAPAPVDERQLAALAEALDGVRPAWVVVPLGFSRTAEVLLGAPMPVLPAPQVLDVVVGRVGGIRRRLGCPVLLENFVHFFPTLADGSEREFFCGVCRESGAGMALDVTALLVNARNHDFDPTSWVRAPTADLVYQIRLGGYRGAAPRQLDDAAEPVASDVLALAAAVAARAPLRAVVVSSDHALASRTRCAATIAQVRSTVAARDACSPRDSA